MSIKVEMELQFSSVVTSLSTNMQFGTGEVLQKQSCNQMCANEMCGMCCIKLHKTV